MIRIEPIPINWNEELPIFAKEEFLQAVSDEYGWLGGLSETGDLVGILPYTIIRKAVFKMVRFRVETIPVGGGLDVREETEFLSGAVGYFRSIGADMIIPATTNTIFRCYPPGAHAAPYGSYIIDLTPPEEVLWRNIDRILRQNIKTALKTEVTINEAAGQIEEAFGMIRETFKRSRLPFMDLVSFRRFISGLGEHGKVLIARQKGVAQSFAVFGFSRYCAYAIYAGNVAGQQQGANKLLYWEAMRLFKSLGVRQYDFVGTRIDPKKGSKQEALSLFKKRFGATLKRGFMWKYPLKQWKYGLYGLAARLRSGGDIVDCERKGFKE
jgi:hypothetical protein